MSIESRRERREERRRFRDFVPVNPEEAAYYKALKKVQRIKGFYSHLLVYFIINTVIIITKVQKIDPGENVWHAFYVPFFWGIGLLAHAFSVFLPNMILGSDWEERKIKEFMENEQKYTTKFE